MGEPSALAPAANRPEPDSDENPVLYVRDGVTYADSRDVAAYFGKRHDDVMRDIHNLPSGPLDSPSDLSDLI